MSRSQASESQTVPNERKSLSTRCREIVFGPHLSFNDSIDEILKDIVSPANNHVEEWAVTQLRNFYHSKGNLLTVPPSLIDEVWLFRDDTKHSMVKSELPDIAV